MTAPPDGPQLLLPLPSEDEHGCRPEVSRAVLNDFLLRARLPKVASAGSCMSTSELVKVMRPIAREDLASLDATATAMSAAFEEWARFGACSLVSGYIHDAVDEAEWTRRSWK